MLDIQNILGHFTAIGEATHLWNTNFWICLYHWLFQRYESFTCMV